VGGMLGMEQATRYLQAKCDIARVLLTK